MQQTKAKQSNTFEFGDKVIISNMFFRNHGMRIQDVGKGTVKEIVPMWESKIPAVKVVFHFNPAFFQMANNGYIKVNTFKNENGFMALVRIHPMYLEKVNGKSK